MSTVADTSDLAPGDSPRFYARVAAAFDQYCHSFVSPGDVPLDRWSAFLDDVLLQAALV